MAQHAINDLTAEQLGRGTALRPARAARQRCMLGLSQKNSARRLSELRSRWPAAGTSGPSSRISPARVSPRWLLRFPVVVVRRAVPVIGRVAPSLPRRSGLRACGAGRVVARAVGRGLRRGIVRRVIRAVAAPPVATPAPPCDDDNDDQNNEGRDPA